MKTLLVWQLFGAALHIVSANPLCANPGRSLEKSELYNPVFKYSVELKGDCKYRDFKVGSIIGKGHYGVVRKGIHKKTGIAVALKYLEAVNPSNYPKHRTEECNQHALESPLLVKHFCTLIHDSHVVFVMEHLDGMTLRSFFQKGGNLTEEQMQYYFAQMMVALEQLHASRIIFGSLTSANVMLLKDGSMKIIDLGASMRLGPNEAQDPTPQFVSWKARPHRWKNYAHDFYSFGLLLFELSYANKHSYLDPKVLIKKHPKCGKVLESRVCDLIHRMYTKDWPMIWGVTKNTRNMIKEHPWFEGVDWHWIEAFANGEVSGGSLESKRNYASTAIEYVEYESEEEVDEYSEGVNGRYARYEYVQVYDDEDEDDSSVYFSF